MTEPRGTIYLVARAPVDMTYQHTIDFQSPEEQRSFWGSLTRYTLTEYSYVRREKRFLQVNKTFDELEGINYLFYRSSDTSKFFYCFVTDREYVNDGLTRLYFDIDVLQSFMFDWELKPSFITQSHVDRWDANRKPIYSITDEGLNYGSEYVTESAFRVAPVHEDTDPDDEGAEDPHGFYLIYCADHAAWVAEGTAAEPTKIYNNPTPYSIYLIACAESSGSREVAKLKYPNTDDVTSGGYLELPATSLEDFQQFMANSAFGRVVHHIVYVPYLPFGYLRDYETNTITFDNEDEHFFVGYGATTLRQPPDEENASVASITLLKIKYILFNATNSFQTLAEMPTERGIELAIPTDAMFDALKSKPLTTEYDRRFQSKLLCYPYRYNVFTDWTGAPALIKNEYIGGDKISVKGSIGFGFNVPRRYWIANYRGDPEGRESGLSQPVPLDQPIISDAYYSYMLDNKNQITANVTNAAINAAAGTVSSAVSGAVNGAAGGVAGAVGGAVLGGVMSGLAGALNVQAGIRSENAKQADLKNLPDTISNSNDCSFAIADGSKYLTLYRKKVCCEYEEQLAQYWHMYGYKVNRLEVPKIRSRRRFNFIKTIGANIAGPIESSYLAQIKAIFDAGVTFWHYTATDFNPLDYTYENPEVSLT